MAVGDTALGDRESANRMARFCSWPALSKACGLSNAQEPVARALNVAFCEGFRMPAAHRRRRELRRPAYES
jgi:hypothetical protein